MLARLFLSSVGLFFNEVFFNIVVVHGRNAVEERRHPGVDFGVSEYSIDGRPFSAAEGTQGSQASYNIGARTASSGGGEALKRKREKMRLLTLSLHRRGEAAKLAGPAYSGRQPPRELTQLCVKTTSFVCMYQFYRSESTHVRIALA